MGRKRGISIVSQRAYAIGQDPQIKVISKFTNSIHKEGKSEAAVVCGLNNITLQNKYPLPRIDELLEKNTGCQGCRRITPLGEKKEVAGKLNGAAGGVGKLSAKILPSQTFVVHTPYTRK